MSRSSNSTVLIIPMSRQLPIVDGDLLSDYPVKLVREAARIRSR